MVVPQPEKQDIQAENSRQQKLGRHLLFRVQPLGMMAHDLDKVIQKSDDAEADRHQEHRNGAGMRGGKDAQTCDQDRRKEGQAAHGGRSLLLQMRLRTVFPHLLTEFQAFQEGNEERTENGAQYKRPPPAESGSPSHYSS